MASQQEINARALRPGALVPPGGGWLERGVVTSVAPLAVRVGGVLLTDDQVAVSPGVGMAAGPCIIATFGAGKRVVIARGA